MTSVTIHLMYLIIQIPCYNESKTLPKVIKDLPKRIKGVTKIEVQIIDDGSTDNTSFVAEKLGVQHIIRLNRNQGLASAFRAGVDNALRLNADILVNTDGDNQYNGKDIRKLIQPIVSYKADVVIGARPIIDHPEFSTQKKLLQRIGSSVVRGLSNTDVSDTTSGFRAYNRESLLKLNVFSSFSYCIETLIQAGVTGLTVISVPIRINSKTRPSRLFKNMFHYLWRTGWTIVEVFLLYRATIIFNVLSGTSLLIGLFLVFRFAYRITFLNSTSATFWPSIVLAGVLLIISFQLFLTGVLTSMISSNRKLSEDMLYRIRKIDVDQNPVKKSYARSQKKTT